MASAADAAELRRLLPKLLGLLSDVASGKRGAADAAGEYISLHNEMRRILASYGEACVCPWPTVWAWQGYAARLDDPDAWLVQQAAKARILAGLEEPPTWTLQDYYREGDQNDIPFWDEFVPSLDPHKQAILETSLRRELAYRGQDVSHGTKGHIWRCNDKPGFRENVLMFTIREGSPFGEVLLRVWFVTASGYRLVLLHGYDKGANTDPGLEERQKDEACARLADLKRQRAAGRATP